jgi:DNA-binding transcriptional LysR family regulator
MLDVRRMRVLREVASRGSIAAAAQALSFTPSAVSQQIAALEREAGVALVERGPRSVRLTEAGGTLVAHTDEVLARLQAAEAEIQAIAGLRGGTLRVASFATAYATIMPGAISEFRRRYPGVELTLTEADPRTSFARLKTSEVELVHLMDDPVNVLLPRTHPAARRRAVRLIDLAAESWITSTPRASCHAFVRRACNAAGFEPELRMQSDDHGTWQGLVAAGVAVALVSELSLPSLHPAVVVRPVAPRPLGRRIYAAHRVGAGRSEAVGAMLEILRAEVAAREPYAETA